MAMKETGVSWLAGGARPVRRSVCQLATSQRIGYYSPTAGEGLPKLHQQTEQIPAKRSQALSE